MKKLAVLCLTSLCLSVPIETASAFGRHCWDCPPPCPPPPITYVDKVVTCYRPEWREEKVKCVVNKVYCRVQEETVKCTVMVPKWADVKHTCTYLVPMPKTVEREVVSCRMVPVQMKDPCTGCAYTCYQPQEFREKVKCTVWECRRESREVTSKVCQYVPQTREVKRQRIIPECRQETVDCVRRYCVMVPQQVKIRVPVCCP